MKSSQRSESINSFFDGYVNSNTPLSEFIEQYEKAIKSRRDMEEKEDLVSMTTTPDFTEMHALEAHVGQVYSRNIFKIFQDEFSKILHCQHSKGVKEGVITKYEVDFKEQGRVHIVKVDVSTKFCKCSCAKFETWGIPCKHILYIMKQKLRLKIIPDEYILPRWTLNVRYKTTSTSCGHNEGEAEASDTYNSNAVTPLEAWTLRGDLNRLYEKVICRRDLYEAIGKDLQEWRKKIEETEKIQMSSVLIENVESNIDGRGSQAPILNFTIRDPAKCKTKGRPRNASRIPTGMQESQDSKQKRNCSSCGQKGHYKSTCKKDD